MQGYPRRRRGSLRNSILLIVLLRRRRRSSMATVSWISSLGSWLSSWQNESPLGSRRLSTRGGTSGSTQDAPRNISGSAATAFAG